VAFRSGIVRVGDRKAGVVRETEYGYQFAYDPGYLAEPGLPPVSLTLPRRSEPYSAKTLFPFFDGLIPEGWLLALAWKTWKLDPRDRMGLLLACCADCIGEVSVTPEAEEA
jgi:serine/threonine-protein kinase HipA